MRNFTKIAVATELSLTAVAANADTQTVATNVTFVEDVTTTVDQAIELGTLVKADGSLSGLACQSGALSGTPQVGAVTVNGATDATTQIDVDASAASDLDISFTPNMVNSTDTATPLGTTAVAGTLTGGTKS
tara:strand:- start:50175 stop:50570 length:396 start_codon:yes stop_codon:yes gene_type:complete